MFIIIPIFGGAGRRPLPAEPIHSNDQVVVVYYSFFPLYMDFLVISSSLYIYSTPQPKTVSARWGRPAKSNGELLLLLVTLDDFPRDSEQGGCDTGRNSSISMIARALAGKAGHLSTESPWQLRPG